MGDLLHCLHNTIARLNQHQERRMIRFSGDVRGEGIRWGPIDEADAILGKDGGQARSNRNRLQCAYSAPIVRV